jgi:hypothetical protein
MLKKLAVLFTRMARRRAERRRIRAARQIAAGTMRYFEAAAEEFSLLEMGR